jgi:predicted unusual protein kinase regulating ubiquinone biosynthesis (AarF/ABC1/UbiB family)
MGKRPGHLGVAWKAGRIASRRLFGRKVGDQDHALTESLVESLDEMKGLAMKIGQIVSYMDVPLPDELQAKLVRLQTGATGRPLTELVAVFESSLGATPAELFETIEEQPIAAASIGQVHRGRVGEREVAVKVQYPEVAQTFVDDLSLVHRLAGLASLASSVDGKAMVEELAARLQEECDYEREARFQQVFARAFREDLAVRIPPVLPELSGSRVLTTGWLGGATLGALAESGSEDQRRRAAETLVRFAYRSLLVHGLIQADPHPGNFAFPADGGVAFYDFGCVRDIGTDLRDALRAMAVAMLHDDREAAREAAIAMGVVGNPKRFDHDHFYEMMRQLHRPFLVPRFTFTMEFVKAAMELNGPRSPNARHMAMPPAYLWVARLQWGLWSVLARLGATGTFDPILREALAEPPSDMGG